MIDLGLNPPIEIDFKNIVAITNRHLCSRPLPQQVERICRLHPKAVILREKDLTEAEYAVLAKEILDICNDFHVPCILHTYTNTARQLSCPAIHLPLPLLRSYQAEWERYSPSVAPVTPEDISSFVSLATSVSHPAISIPVQQKLFPVLGTSVHSAAEAVEAEALGASYLTAGHIYATDCKKGLPPRGLSFLKEICQSVSIPVYAIGGIKLNGNQLAEVMQYGAEGGCVMSGMMEL